ncbi:type IV secretory system conjugative DNA transfer family protein [Arthrobacter rhombi]|uniref:type IV secretory system conjugative DNA transfer family protein n=1 Tax=Arthrobacter rhombi TaxID=71253 RepID=UPI003FD09A9E
MSEDVSVRQQRAATSGTKKVEFEIFMWVIIMAALWHVALVITTKLAFGDYLQTLQALVDTVLRGRTPVDVGGNARDAWAWPVGVWVGLLALLFAGYITMLHQLKLRRERKTKAARTRKNKSKKNDHGLSTAKEMKARISGPEKAELAPPVFVYLGKAVGVRAEDTACVIAPPRAGKTTFIVAGQVVDAPGAVITTSTRPDVLRLTAGARRDKGRVYVADFDGLSSYPDKVRWNVVAGCEDDQVASERAAAMVNAMPRKGPPSAAEGHFNTGCTIILEAMLHAAALKRGGTMRDVIAWSQNFQNLEPKEIIEEFSSTVPLWGANLDEWCRDDNPDTIGNTKTTLGKITGPMKNEKILSMLCPVPGDPGIDTARFTDQGNTLYCLARPSMNASTAPIVTALVETITQEAVRASGRTASGRLAKHLSLILDEAPNTCALPSLPSLMSEGGGNGIHTWVFAQSRSQLVARWGEDGAETIVNASAARVLFGAISDNKFLNEISDLIGKEWAEHTSSSSNSGKDGTPGVTVSKAMHLDQKMRPDQIRKLPQGKVLLVYREIEAVVQVIPWWKRPDKKVFEESRLWCLGQEGIEADQAKAIIAEQEAKQKEVDAAIEAAEPEEDAVPA